jgi:uncharacterized protein YodC (DUF2158 family)
MKIKSGDLVVLKSGSPIMTVGAPSQVEPNVFMCHYFAFVEDNDGNGYPTTLEFHKDALVKVKKEKKVE